MILANQQLKKFEVLCRNINESKAIILLYDVYECKTLSPWVLRVSFDANTHAHLLKKKFYLSVCGLATPQLRSDYLSV